MKDTKTPKELPVPKPVGNFIIGKADKVGIDGHYYHYQTVCRMLQEYSDQQNAELLAKIAQLENSYAKFAKERDEQYGEYIDLNVGLRNENAELRERVKELEVALQDLVDWQNKEVKKRISFSDTMANARRLLK